MGHQGDDMSGLWACWTRNPRCLQCAFVDPDTIRELSPDAWRADLPRLFAERVDDPALSAAVSAELAELLASWTDADAASILDAVADVGAERRVYDAHPVLRQTAREWMQRILAGSTLEGAENLTDAVAAGPTAVVCNHRSYIDSNAIDSILCSHGLQGVADHFVSVAGPKVYEGLLRRVVSASLSTLPVPQSATLGHTARLPGRDLARQSLEAVRQAHAAMSDGCVLLIYPEGARSRTGRMQPFLPAVYRYFKLPGARIVPAALTGTAEVMGVGERGVRPDTCALRFGPLIDAEKAGGPREALAQAQAAVCELLPPELRLEANPAEVGS